MSDDHESIIDRIKELFNLDSEIFDIDFYIFPDSKFKDENDISSKQKGFKMSYHYESGMDKPEIKIESDIQENKINEFLKRYNFNDNNSNLKNLANFPLKKEIDAKNLSLKPNEQKKASDLLEPYTEMNDFDGFFEIIIEVPGIEKNDVSVNLDKKKRKITFSAQRKNRNYLKEIFLPFNIYMIEYELDVNNGIATLKFKKQKSQD